MRYPISISLRLSLFLSTLTIFLRHNAFLKLYLWVTFSLLKLSTVVNDRFVIFCNLFVTYSIIVICNNCTHEIAWRSNLLCLLLANTLPYGSAHFKNVNNCLNTKISSYLETSGGQSSNLYVNVVHFFNNSVK